MNKLTPILSDLGPAILFPDIFRLQKLRMYITIFICAMYYTSIIKIYVCLHVCIYDNICYVNIKKERKC